VAWVNNQFRQYVFDVTSFVETGVSQGSTNLTVAFESAWHYGLNVTSRSDAVFYPGVDVRGMSELPLRAQADNRLAVQVPRRS
jgi:hypothetical protein